MAYCKPLSALVWNLVYSLASVWASSHVSEPGSFDSNLVDLMMSAVLVLAAQQRHRALWREARCNEQVATTDLLTLVCDAVVELDDELKIAEHTPKLALNLQHFMPIEEDRKRFEAHLSDHETIGEPEPSFSSRSGALHATMRDSMSGRLQVEMFFVRFHSISGRRQYLVGIREFMDQPLCELKKFRQQPQRPHNADHPQLHDSPVIVADHNMQSHEIEDKASSVPSSCGSGGTQFAGTHVISENFLPTTMKAKALTLIAMMHQWNFDVTPGACCPFHAAVRDARKCCEWLRRSRCKQNFLSDPHAQCKSCGILYDDEDIIASPPTSCEVCGEEGTVCIRPRQT
eukprot:CAMPEP_0115592718 /NCGR_PEP_ID=MMETSP0272-20121206/10929_1 /TAXON_ID=71861 /ORGANISM="Scrippsiella trochoidea, Strain CCMP3099" /LENGTH=343 /DNA_ID=CAMNT_0003027963 /DNA_START=406 /DNA_END=1434 /DNA_ORIENTATION=+